MQLGKQSLPVPLSTEYYRGKILLFEKRPLLSQLRFYLHAGALFSLKYS